MIVPLTSEASWQNALEDLPLLRDFPASGIMRAVVVSPHPDDETLGAGGLIASLSASRIDVTIVAVTDGENAYEGVSGLGQVRALEQARAAKKLGVTNEIVRLKMTDSSVTADETALDEKLTDLFDSQTLVLAPWTGDFHPDHEACGRAAQQAAQRTRATLAFYFFWTWHRGTPQTLSGLSLRKFPLQPEWLAAKQSALLQHASQLHRTNGPPILPNDLLEPSRRAYEVYLLP